HLPDGQGYELLEWMNSQPDHCNTRVIIYSGDTPDPGSMPNNQTNVLVLNKQHNTPGELMDSVHQLLSQMFVPIPSQPPIPRANATSLQTILVVDDDIRNIYAVNSLLEERNYTVLTADNGESALQQIEQHANIDLVLMDIAMPVMDGYTAIRKLRAADFAKPIIAVTAYAMQGDREKCLEAGANDYLAKPINKQMLYQALDQWRLP
ncbi:response regulator, partial [Chitinivorax sp. B]|uniref:response regulator n=1 Tax=Chitinivorax sp. B TaxID=2502235 RepID=UPI0010FA3332